jgi:hypothetical protein
MNNKNGNARSLPLLIVAALGVVFTFLNYQ